MKRITSMLLTLAMIIALMPMKITAAEKQPVFTDITGVEYYADSAEILSELGILTGYGDGTYGAEKNVKRAEMAAIICRILDKEADAKSATGETSFDDVSAEHWASGYINIAAQEGIINGDGNGKFRPEANVKYEEAIKMLVCALGYGEALIPDPNDWSKMYLEIAEDIGITYSLKGKKGEPATRGDIAVMVFNGIETSDLFKDKLAEVDTYNLWSEYNPGYACEVTYMMNDGTDNVYTVQYVKAGKNASLPAEPTRNMYEFTGWYADDKATEPYDFSNQLYGGDKVYAGWKAARDDADAYMSANEAETIYSITEMEMKNGVVETKINVNTRAILVLNFLDENTKEVIATLSATTPDYGELLPISIPVIYELPEHFIITGDLYNRNSQKLCETYTCFYYTSAYEKFDEQTVNDFEADRVISFDGSETNNFGVLNESVISINSSDSTNKLSVEEIDHSDEDNITTERIYTVENPDSSVTSLKEGDKVYFKSTSYLFKIGTVSNDGGKVVMTESGDASVQDFYDVLKVNMPEEINPLGESEWDAEMGETVQVVMEGTTDKFVYDILKSQKLAKNEPSMPLQQDMTPYSFPYSMPRPATFNINSTYFEGKVGVDISGVIQTSFAYDVRNLSDAFFNCMVRNDMTSVATIDVTAKAGIPKDGKLREAEKEIDLPKIKIPTNIPGMAVAINTSLVYGLGISGDLHVEYITKNISGFYYGSIGNYINVESYKDNDVRIEAGGDVTLKAGVKVRPALELLDGALSAGITCEAGVQAQGELNLDIEEFNEEYHDTKHGCDVCVGGTVHGYLQANGSLDYKLSKKLDLTSKDEDVWLSGSFIDFEIAKLKIAFEKSEFYCSFKNDEDSLFEGKVAYGWGECPNYAYKTTITAKKSSGNNVATDITVKKSDGKFSEKGASAFKPFLYPGKYTATATIEGQEAWKRIEVKDKPQSVNLVVKPEGHGTLHIVHYTSGNACNKKRINIYEIEAGSEVLHGSGWFDGHGETEGVGTMTDSGIPAGDYVIRHRGKVQYVTINAGDYKTITINCK